jgi:nucleotide-binding universal stress UspA family protein
MYKSILLCTDGSPAADVAADHAIALAGKFHAHLIALYVTDIRVLEGPLLSDLSGAIGAQPYSTLLPQIEQLQRDKAGTILGAVARRCADKGVEAEIVHETGSFVQTMRGYESRADLVVLGQHGEHAKWLEGMLGSSVERMVRASVKPCLVTTDRFRPTNHILIAHDGSAESTKALRAGIDLAANLNIEVTITTVGPNDNTDAATKILKDAQQLALARKLTVHTQLRHGDAEIEILMVSEESGADLIVMGAYGHTRIRQLILGSTTSHVLRESRVPVLLVRG